MPSPVTNHSLPSADFATRGPYWLAALERSLTPSAASQTVVAILRFGSAIHASTSVRVMRTRPQRIQPQRTFVVIYRPIRSVAGQTIPARERRDVAIFDPAQAAILGCGPQRPIPIELKMLDRG